MNQSSADRALGTSSLAALVVASMVGAGIFTTSGFTLASLHDPWLVLAAWAVGGGIALAGARSYAQLAACLHESGGEYVFLARFVHPAAGFVAGWVSLIVGFSAAAAYAATAFEHYAMPDAWRPGWLPEHAVATLLVVAATLAHAFRTRAGVAGQNSLVAIKLVLLGSFVIVAAALSGQWSGGQSPLPREAVGPASPAVAFATALVWISLSYCGFNAAVYVAEEAKLGARSVGRAMVVATAGVTVLYLALNVIFLFAPAPHAIAGQSDVAAIAAAAIGGPWFANLTRIAICVALASSVSSCLLAGPRVAAKMAADGVLPRTLGSLTSPPTKAVLVQGAAIVVMVNLATLRDLLDYLSLTLSVVSAGTVAALLAPAVRRRAGGALGSRGIPWAAVLYVTATVMLAAVMAYDRPINAAASAATVASGLVLYGIQTRWQAASARSETE